MDFSKNKKARESQRKIYKGLRKILERKPLEEITIVDIQNECHISRATFYRNFNNVIDILEVVFAWYYDEYEKLKATEEDKLEFFFKYWELHKDLLKITIDNNIDILKKCITKYSKNKNPIFIETKNSLMSTLIIYWTKHNELSIDDMKTLVSDNLNINSITLLLK